MIFSPKLPIHLNPLQPRGRRRRHLAAPNHARTPTHHLRQCRRITTTRLPQAYQSSFIRSTSKFCRRILAHTRPSQTASSCASKLSEGSVDADLRRRCKYLSHIPEGVDVVFVEADLEGVVGPEGLRAFEGTIKARRARRREKDRRDEKARVRAEEREREKLFAVGAGAPSRTITAGGSPAWGTYELEPELDQDVSRAASPSPTLSPTAPQARPQQQQQRQQSGAWGARSFAAAANAGRGGSAVAPARNARPQLRYDGEDEGVDEWTFELDLDRAWRELEGQRERGPNGGSGSSSGGGGTGTGRRRRARMVVLGGGGAPHGAAGRRR